MNLASEMIFHKRKGPEKLGLYQIDQNAPFLHSTVFDENYLFSGIFKDLMKNVITNYKSTRKTC